MREDVPDDEKDGVLDSGPADGREPGESELGIHVGVAQESVFAIAIASCTPSLLALFVYSLVAFFSPRVNLAEFPKIASRTP